MIDRIKKIESNKRYINQGSYDFDGNANNNNSFEADFSAQKNITIKIFLIIFNNKNLF